MWNAHKRGIGVGLADANICFFIWTLHFGTRCTPVWRVLFDSQKPVHRRSGLAQQLWQLRDIGRDPPRLVAGEQLGRRSPARLLLVVHGSKLLAGAALHDEARADIFD
jgi:hypothetical protein